MDIKKRLSALEAKSASGNEIKYVEEVLRRVRAAAENYTGSERVISVEIPERGYYEKY